MAKKENTIELEAGERKEPFEIDHAERILRMPNNGGWKLPNDSKYQFDNENGITRKTQDSSKGAKAAAEDTKSD